MTVFSLRRLLVALMLAALPFAARADYPDKPITFVVPFAAGGSLDVTARILADRLRMVDAAPPRRTA